MSREPLVTPTRASSAVRTVHTFFSIFARTFCFSKASFVSCVIQYADLSIIKRVHLMEDLVSTFGVAAAADIEVLAEEFFTTITVHVNIR